MLRFLTVLWSSDHNIACAKMICDDTRLFQRYLVGAHSGRMLLLPQPSPPSTGLAAINSGTLPLRTIARLEPWLSGAAGLELLKPAPDDMLQRWPVSKQVISSRAPADDPTLIDPIELAAVSV